MEEISKLIQEAKPLYFARKKRKKTLIASSMAIFCCCIIFLANYKQNSPIYDTWSEEIYSVSNGSIIEDLGLPVDEYGLLWIG